MFSDCVSSVAQEELHAQAIAPDIEEMTSVAFTGWGNDQPVKVRVELPDNREHEAGVVPISPKAKSP